VSAEDAPEDVFDEDDYVLGLLETLSPTLRRALRAAPADSKPEAEFYVSHKLRYRNRRPDEWARVVEVLRIYPDDRPRLVRLIDEMDADDAG
jgi:hypothetical protein